MAEIEFIDGPRKGNNLKLGKSYTSGFGATDLIRVPWMNPETNTIEYLIYERVWKRNRAGQVSTGLEYKLSTQEYEDGSK